MTQHDMLLDKGAISKWGVINRDFKENGAVREVTEMESWLG